MNRFYQKNGQLFRVQRFWCRVWIRFVFFLLFHGFRACLEKDPIVQDEVNGWQEGFAVKIAASKTGPFLILKKEHGGIFRLFRSDGEDLTIAFKSLSGAFRVTSFRQGIRQAFAANQMTMSGEIRLAMSFVRCMEEVELQLLPNVLAKRLLTKRSFASCDHWTIYKALIYSMLGGASKRNNWGDHQ